MTIRGKEQFVKGTVFYLLADTLAAHTSGGLREDHHVHLGNVETV